MYGLNQEINLHCRHINKNMDALLKIRAGRRVVLCTALLCILGPAPHYAYYLNLQLQLQLQMSLQKRAIGTFSDIISS